MAVSNLPAQHKSLERVCPNHPSPLYPSCLPSSSSLLSLHSLLLVCVKSPSLATSFYLASSQRLQYLRSRSFFSLSGRFIFVIVVFRVISSAHSDSSSSRIFPPDCWHFASLSPRTSITFILPQFLPIIFVFLLHPPPLPLADLSPFLLLLLLLLFLLLLLLLFTIIILLLFLLFLLLFNHQLLLLPLLLLLFVFLSLFLFLSSSTRNAISTQQLCTQWRQL